MKLTLSTPTPEEISQAINENNQVLKFINEWQVKNNYNPQFLTEYNAKFNAEFWDFLDNSKLSESTKNFFKSPL